MMDFAPRLCCVALMLAATGGALRAAEGEPAEAAKPAAAKVAPTKPPIPEPVLSPDVASYCQNLVPTITNAKAVAEAAQLMKLQIEISSRMAELETRKAEVEALVKKHENFLQLADEAKTSIYLKMKPDAAAAQLAMMDENVGAAIISKLPPRTASVILAEMPAEQAARLTTMLGGPKVPDKHL